MGVPKLATFKNTNVKIVTQQSSDVCPFPVVSNQNLSLSVVGSISLTDGNQFKNIQNITDYVEGRTYEILVNFNLYDLHQKKVVAVNSVVGTWSGSDLSANPKPNLVQFSGDLGEAFGECEVSYTDDGKQVWLISCASEKYGYWNAAFRQ